MARRRAPLDRYLAPRLREALADAPAVLIHGPRQCGKTTLARMIGDARGFRYVSFDDGALQEAARYDPTGLVQALPQRVILDEVQRVPQIFTALKAEIDRRRTSGRFILTGSANVLLVPALSESLAGRMRLLRLHPLAQCELHRRRPWFVHALFGRRFRSQVVDRLGIALVRAVASGGYPAALARPTPARRRMWYRDLIETQIQRDVRDIARLHSLDALPRLMMLAASYTAQLINVSELSAPFHMTRQTIHDYVTVLERVFLVHRLAPWHANHLTRLIKTPKLHIGDTGLACALLGLDAAGLSADRARFGALLETFVLQELRRQASWRPDPVEFFHYRDRDGFEVDIVLEQGSDAVAGIEVKAASSVSADDFRGLRKLRDKSGRRFACGVVLYDGPAVVKYDKNLFAVPIRLLWEDA